MERRYLGDSVYIEPDGHQLKLFTDNEYGPREVVYLEPEVLNALVEYAKQFYSPGVIKC